MPPPTPAAPPEDHPAPPSGADLAVWLATADPAPRQCEWRASVYAGQADPHRKVPARPIRSRVSHWMRIPRDTPNSMALLAGPLPGAWHELTDSGCTAQSAHTVKEPILPHGNEHRTLHLCEYHAEMLDLNKHWYLLVRRYPVPAVI